MKALDGSMPITRDDVLATIELHAQELQRLGARSLALFGSVARGEGTEASDRRPSMPRDPEPPSGLSMGPFPSSLDP